jgi:hypothetical protein
MLSKMAGFQLHWIWWLSAGSIVFQLVISLLLLRREFRRKLAFDAPQPSLAEPSPQPVDQPEGIAQVT